LLIRVKFYGRFNAMMGRRWVVTKVPFDVSVRMLIQILSNQQSHSRFAEAILTPTGQRRTGVSILLNGRNITYLNGLDTPLKQRDVVTFLATAGGG
jgi:molybdopterin converting factor small subunit